MDSFAIRLVAREVLHMAFQIRPDRHETDNKSVRFPVPLIEKIEAAIQGKDLTFSGFVIQACEYALANMDAAEKDAEK